MSHLDSGVQRRPRRGHGPALATTALAILTVLAAGVPLARAGERAAPPARAAGTAAGGWSGIVRVPVSIDMGNDWTASGELSYPRGAGRRLPLVVLLHGSGHNDMDETLPGGGGSVFVPVAQAANRRGFAVLRFNKRGVTGIGPVLTTAGSPSTRSSASGTGWWSRSAMMVGAVLRRAGGRGCPASGGGSRRTTGRSS